MKIRNIRFSTSGIFGLRASALAHIYFVNIFEKHWIYAYFEMNGVNLVVENKQAPVREIEC